MSADDYRGALANVERIVNRERDAGKILRAVVTVLHERFDHYSWIGIYLVEGDELVLGSWQGPQETEHVRIPIGRGICGAAAATGRTELVDDVSADERYLACFTSTRSEIVVPVSFDGVVVGEIDVDSDAAAAFREADRALLERVATLVSPYAHEAAQAGSVVPAYAADV